MSIFNQGKDIDASHGVFMTTPGIVYINPPASDLRDKQVAPTPQFTHEVELKLVLEAKDYEPQVAVFSQDGQRIISASSTLPSFLIWDVNEGDVVKGPVRLTEVSNDSHSTNFIQLSPDGRRVAVGPVSFLEQDPSSPKYGQIVVVQNTVTMWDVEAGEVGEASACPEDSDSPISFHHAVFSPDGNKLVLAGSFDSVRVWDVVTGATVTKPMHVGEVFPIACSPSGDKVVSVGSYDKRAKIWAVTTAKVMSGPHPEFIEKTKSTVKSFAFLPDGKHIAAGFEDGKIIVIDGKTGNITSKPEQFNGHEAWITCLAVSPDGTMLASGSCDGTIRVWNIKTGYIVSEPLKGHGSTIWSVAFAPGVSKTNIVSTSSGDVRVWAATPLSAEA